MPGRRRAESAPARLMVPPPGTKDRRLGRRLAVLAVLGAGFALVTLLAAGPLSQLDRALADPWVRRSPELRAVFEILVRLGQRAVCLPALLVVAVLSARRCRTWQPVVLSIGAVLTLNVLVGITKLATGRGAPLLGDPAFFQEGVMYPSGHAANAVLVYGLAAALSRRAWGSRSVVAVALLALTVAASLLMVVTGLYFGWHWFSDLVAGLLAGGLVLQAAVILDFASRSRDPSQ